MGEQGLDRDQDEDEEHEAGVVEGVIGPHAHELVDRPDPEHGERQVGDPRVDLDRALGGRDRCGK